MSKAMIESFLSEMRERHSDEIDAVDLPDGTLEYVRERAAAGDADTLLFMLKLGYLMGLQTGFAAGMQGGDDGPPRAAGTPGPLKA